MSDNTIMAVGLANFSLVSDMLGLGLEFAAVPFLGLFLHDLAEWCIAALICGGNDEKGSDPYFSRRQ